MKKIIYTSIIILANMYVSFAANYFVDVSTGSNGNVGDAGHPFKTITKALSVSSSGDNITVVAGTYDMTAGEVFPLNMVSGVSLIGTSGASETIIDASGADNQVLVCDGTNSSTLIRGFTITGGNLIGDPSTLFTARGGGVYFKNGDASIFERNIVRDNSCTGYAGQLTGSVNGGNGHGGGIYVESNCTSLIRNNIIKSNSAHGGNGRGYGGGFSGEARPGGQALGGGLLADGGTIINNTIYGNLVQGGSGGATNSGMAADMHGDGGIGRGAGFYSFGSNPVIKNNIFHTNEALAGLAGSGANPGTGSHGAIYSAAATNTNNLFFNNTAETSNDDGDVGSNSVSSDPFLYSPSNFNVRTSSPAIAAGTSSGAPTVDFAGTTRTGTPTIGAYHRAAATPTNTGSETDPSSGIDVQIASTGVTVLTTGYTGYIKADYFSTGRSGSIPTAVASGYYWTVTGSNELQDAVNDRLRFDWLTSATPGVSTPANVKLLYRSGPSMGWVEIGSATLNSTTLSVPGFIGFGDYALGSNSGNTLPVSVVNFDCASGIGGITLNWATVQEINNDYFEVEKTADHQTWEVVGRVAGKGNSNEINVYTINDPDATPVVAYYRLKQVDADGTIHYPAGKEIACLEEKQLSAVDFNVIPNPNQGSFKIRMNGTAPGAKITIYNTVGKTVAEHIYNNGSGYLDVKDLEGKGIFFIRVTDSQSSFVQKIQVL